MIIFGTKCQKMVQALEARKFVHVQLVYQRINHMHVLDQNCMIFIELFDVMYRSVLASEWCLSSHTLLHSYIANFPF